MNTFDKFALAERAEQVFAEVYGLLARQFAQEPKYHALFTRLEQEEIQHAMRIKMLRKRYVTMGKDMKELVLEIAPLQAFLKQGETTRQRLAAGETLGTVTEVVARIAELERQLAGAHAEMILAVGDASLRNFFKKLAAQDRGHAALLCQ